MKDRTKRSPDHADAASLCVYLALKMGLSGSEEAPKPPTPPWMPKATAAPKPQYASGHSQQSTYRGWR